jgi:hypothetical protein
MLVKPMAIDPSVQVQQKVSFLWSKLRENKRNVYMHIYIYIYIYIYVYVYVYIHIFKTKTSGQSKCHGSYRLSMYCGTWRLIQPRARRMSPPSPRIIPVTPGMGQTPIKWLETNGPNFNSNKYGGIGLPFQKPFN